MAAGKVEVLLVVPRFDVDRDAEAWLVNKYVNIKEGDMGKGNGPGKLDRVASIEALKEKKKGRIKYMLVYSTCQCWKLPIENRFDIKN